MPMIGFLGAASAEHSARSSRASVYSSRNSLWRAIQRKTVALPGIPASLQMARRLLPYAERKGLIYLWEGTPAFARRQRLLSRDQYELAEVRTSRRGVRPAMLFPKAILEAEWAADAPFREAMAIKRERLRALRAKRAAK
jgi:hypothetical protein